MSRKATGKRDERSAVGLAGELDGGLLGDRWDSGGRIGLGIK